jgi:hypothetical protein
MHRPSAEVGVVTRGGVVALAVLCFREGVRGADDAITGGEAGGEVVSVGATPSAASAAWLGTGVVAGAEGLFSATVRDQPVALATTMAADSIARPTRAEATTTACLVLICNTTIPRFAWLKASDGDEPYRRGDQRLGAPVGGGLELSTSSAQAACSACAHEAETRPVNMPRRASESLAA